MSKTGEAGRVHNQNAKGVRRKGWMREQGKSVGQDEGETGWASSQRGMTVNDGYEESGKGRRVRGRGESRRGGRTKSGGRRSREPG